MNRLQRMALAPFVALAELLLIAIFIACCARAVCDCGTKGKR